MNQKFNISQNNVFIIAEAGVNHNHSLELAIDLVRVGAEAGADAVKFQTFKAGQVVTVRGGMADYQKINTGQVKSQREMLAELEFGEKWYPKVVAECKKQGVMFMSTPHGGRESIKLLDPYVETWKVGSGDMKNYLLLDAIVKTGKPMILSSGMYNLEEIRETLEFLRKRGVPGDLIGMLHCTTNYPCLPEQVNLALMQTMIKELPGITVGYSDHTVGNQVAVMAVTLGAKIYECHFTLDKNLPGPDHMASAEPSELKERITMIRRISTIMGDSNKQPNQIETEKMRPLVTRSLVAARDLKRGEKLTVDDLEAKRPGDGVSPSKFESFISKRLKKDLSADEQIHFSDIE